MELNYYTNQAGQRFELRELPLEPRDRRGEGLMGSYEEEHDEEE